MPPAAAEAFGTTPPPPPVQELAEKEAVAAVEPSEQEPGQTAAPVPELAAKEEVAAAQPSEQEPGQTAAPVPDANANPAPPPPPADKAAPQKTAAVEARQQPDRATGAAPRSRAGEGGRPEAEEGSKRQPSTEQAVTAATSEPDAPSPAPPGEERGLVVASLKGDLKLVAAGDGVRIFVTFRDFPRSRRQKPTGKAQAKRLKQVTPVCAQNPDGTGEAVIARAEEGVYTFSAEPRGAAPAQTAFTLKIYEGGAGGKVAPLGRRSIAQRSVVAKVLMPEAILWDDQTAFTGSLQDAESTTKFNSQTGLYWKEYDD